jgi:uncharacterized YigZ family protein
MITIKNTVETELIIKKSRFLGLACRTGSEAEAQRILEQRRKQHYDARHHCFAYMIENSAMRCSDDGEPQGTAGVPMLEVLKKSGITDVIVVCTRYFGGTLLGAGGLVRAYTQSAADTLNAARRVEVISCEVFRCDFDFAAWARAEKALGSLGFAAGNVQYTHTVSAEYGVTAGEEQRFLQALTNITQGKVSPVPLGTRLAEIDI